MKCYLVLLAVLTVVKVNGDVLKYEPLLSKLGRQNEGANNLKNDLPEKWTPPSFCNNIDCPEYKVDSKNDKYEVRTYKASKWVSTSLTGVDFEAAQNQMFDKLFKYISGSNVKKTKIAMTAPVRTRIIPGPGPACENNFTMSFFVSPSEGVDIPAPTDRTLSITSLEDLTVYVKYFGGFAYSEKKWLDNAKELGDAVKADGGSFVEDYYYIDGYDSPFKIFNRHNEVWFIKK